LGLGSQDQPRLLWLYLLLTNLMICNVINIQIEMQPDEEAIGVTH